ncbi:MAG: exopolysaccharide biosynthesis protein [Amaricoccus sp.]|uniref:exopolysaccharide biosynthesis protein n=1 Tax=Amaricoccus sp. TaxID=1872485 RepID=UPI0039E61461
MAAPAGAGISGVLRRLARSGTGERVSFGDLVEAFEIGAYGPLIVLFAAPNILPVALPGISAVLGAPLILVTAQMMLGRRRPWLPGIIRRRSVRRVDLARLVERVVPRLERLEARMRPRHAVLTGRVGRRVVGAIGLLLATIIFLPIPFGNSLPGLALVLMALGLLARDGLMVAAGGGVAAAGVVVASGFAWGLAEGGAHLVEQGFGL